MGCKQHRAVISSDLLFTTCHAEQAWGFSELTLEGKCYWKVRIAFPKQPVAEAVAQAPAQLCCKPGCFPDPLDALSSVQTAARGEAESSSAQSPRWHV